MWLIRRAISAFARGSSGFGNADIGEDIAAAFFHPNSFGHVDSPSS
jgi:hypothetical protein